MYVACLTPGAEPAVIRRAMCGVPRVDALLLVASNQSDGADWLVGTLRDLRRELFLDPELLVLGSVPAPMLDRALVGAAELLIESRCEGTTIGKIGIDLQQVANDRGSLQNLAAKANLPDDAVIDRVDVRWGASPLVDSLQSLAKITLVADAAPGSLGVASVFEALQLTARDWDRLATVAAISCIVEQPDAQGPLWLEVDEAGQPTCLGPDTYTAEAFQRQLACLTQQLIKGQPSPDVTIDLSGVSVQTARAGRHLLQGVTGGPPGSDYTVEVSYRAPTNSSPRQLQTSLPRSDVGWEVVVRTASDWARSS